MVLPQKSEVFTEIFFLTMLPIFMLEPFHTRLAEMKLHGSDEYVKDSFHLQLS